MNSATFDAPGWIGALRDTVVSTVLASREADEAIRAASDLRAPAVRKYFRPTVKTCLFCGRLGECPAVQELMVGIVKQYEPAAVPADIHGWSSEDPAELAIGLQVADLAKRWAETWRKRHTERCLERPDLVPAGYQLVATTPTKVVDKPGLMRHLVQQFGADKVAELTEVPLTPFIKEVRAKAPRGEKDNAEVDFRAELESKQFTKPSDVPTLALRMK